MSPTTPLVNARSPEGFEINTGAKSPPSSGEHDESLRRIVEGDADCVIERDEHCGRQRIERIGPVERNRRDGSVHIDKDLGVIGAHSRVWHFIRSVRVLGRWSLVRRVLFGMLEPNGRFNGRFCVCSRPVRWTQRRCHSPSSPSRSVPWCAGGPSCSQDQSRWGQQSGASTSQRWRTSSLAKLCWYQRIAMYPLAVLLVMAAVRRDQSMLLYVRVIALLDSLFRRITFGSNGFRRSRTFASLITRAARAGSRRLIAITIPQMAGLSFVLIIATATIGLRPSAEPSASEESVA